MAAFASPAVGARSLSANLHRTALLAHGRSSPRPAFLTTGKRTASTRHAKTVRNAKPGGFGDDAKGAVGGAILGGVLLGPLGALFGAQIGNAMGADSERRKEYVDELQSRGVTPEMVELAQSVGKDLADGEQALEICATAAESASARYSQLEAGVAEAYNDAMAAVQAGDDAAARRFLQEKAERSKKLEAVEQELAEAGQRLKVTRRAVEALEGRVQEVESLIQRSMSMAASDRAQSLSPDSSTSTSSYIDPLEQKFRDMENR